MVIYAAVGCKSEGTRASTLAQTAAGGANLPSVPGGMSLIDAGSSTIAGSAAALAVPSSGGAGTAGIGMSSGRTASRTGGTGGISGISGTSGMGGSRAGAGSGAAGKAGAGGAVRVTASVQDEDAGVAMCVPPQKPLDFSSAPKCPTQICSAQDSICLPTDALRALVPQSTVNLLAKCDDKQTCVPLELARAAGKGIQPTCKSLGGVEGRCISRCVPQVAQQASLLPQDVCTGSDLCAPCYDPRTAQDTLACRQGCDSGPKEGPKPFPRCCSERGLCVPPALAGAQAKNLDRDTCTGDSLCAPKELTDLAFKPKTCSSIDGAEGRCISTCVGGAVAKQRERLPTAGCAAEEVCAPCYDPVSGDDTGACSINGDTPGKPQQVFDACCGTVGTQPVGVCVPPSLAGAQADILRQESCRSGRVCAPTRKAADPSYKFPSCFSLLGNGVCVQHCILDPLQAAILTRSQCAAGELCAPCDLLGVSTKACE